MAVVSLFQPLEIFSSSLHEVYSDHFPRHTVSGFQVMPSTILSQSSNKTRSLIDFFEKIKPQDTYLPSAFITEKTLDLDSEGANPGPYLTFIQRKHGFGTRATLRKHHDIP